MIVCSEDVAETAREAARACGVELGRVLVIGGEEGGFRISSLGGGKGVEGGREELDWERVTDTKTLEERSIVVLYSSGTTGVPKGELLLAASETAEANGHIRRPLIEYEYSIGMFYSFGLVKTVS